MKMTPSQIKKISRINNYYIDANAYTEVTEVECKDVLLDWGSISVTIQTSRTDCGKYSPRAIVCEQYGHFLISRRGKITVCSARHGCSDEEFQAHHKKHVAYMIGGKCD